MPLYTLAIIDRHGSGQPVAQSLVYREDQAHISMLLTAFKKLCADNGGVDTSRSIFMVDKDSAEIAALAETFPGQQILLCRFHVVKAMIEEIKKMPLSSTDKETLVSVSKASRLLPYGCG